MAVVDYFSLKGKTAVVTGGDGLLGRQWCKVLREAGAEVVSIDLIRGQDVTSERWQGNYDWSKTDILINNACNDPQVGSMGKEWDLEQWIEDLNVGLTGAFLCCKYAGRAMEGKGGVILNIGSNLSVIAPDQRIYSGEKKPASYTVLKHGLVGLTRWAATYWASKNIRVNCLSLGGVYNKQPKEFVNKLTELIPMDRMARIDEYRGALLFMVSDASSYMTGANVIIDGGRSIW